jgi:hypothetical protein
MQNTPGSSLFGLLTKALCFSIIAPCKSSACYRAQPEETAMSFLIVCVLNIISFFAGVFFCAVALVPSLIIMCFGIPYTMELNRKGILKSYAPTVHSLVSLAALFSVFSAATWGCYHFLLKGLSGYICGAGLALIMGLYRCAKSKVNLFAYWREDTRYLAPRCIMRAAQIFLLGNNGSIEKTDRTDPDPFLMLLRTIRDDNLTNRR